MLGSVEQTQSEHCHMLSHPFFFLRAMEEAVQQPTGLTSLPFGAQKTHTHTRNEGHGQTVLSMLALLLLTLHVYAYLFLQAKETLQFSIVAESTYSDVNIRFLFGGVPVNPEFLKWLRTRKKMTHEQWSL
eukprot:2677188-Amphidinium_carterae.1